MTSKTDSEASKTPPRVTSSQDEPVRLKRFYKIVSVQAVSVDGPGPGHHAIHLDDRPIKTPGRNKLALPTAALAAAIGEEWSAQGEFVEPQSMPLTKLSNTIIDGILVDPDAIRKDLAAFANQDLICYRADRPDELVEMQAKAWDPFVKWAQGTFKARPVLTAGIMPVEQSVDYQHGAQAHIAKLEPWALGPIHVMTTLVGSAVMALAHADGTWTAEDVWKAAHVDEDWQAENWGHDAEAAERRKFRTAEMMAAARFLALSRDHS
ncbi:MAG: ATP12 family protein [Pseudomonadota bacterium]